MNESILEHAHTLSLAGDILAIVAAVVFILFLIDCIAYRIVHDRYIRSFGDSMKGWDTWLTSDVYRRAKLPLGSVPMLFTFKPGRA